MVWTQDTYDELVDMTKDVMVDLAQIICNNMDLGKSIDQDLDLLEYACNLYNGLKYGVLIYQDEHFDYLNEQVMILRTRCRKYLNV